MKVNDIVRFLNDVGGGRIVRIEGNTAYVEDADGFERPALTRDLVVIDSTQAGARAFERPIEVKTRQVEPDKPKFKPEPQQPVLPVVETPEGDTLNVLLAFEPREVKHLNTTTFFGVIVNDSNYFLDITFLTRAAESDMWTTRFHGTIEPNMQETLCEISHDDLPQMDRIAVQYIAYKPQKAFRLKNPALVEQRLDTTKFYKLHCFQPNEYFDNPVLAVDITRNDLPVRQYVIDSSQLENAMREKRGADFRASRKQVSKPKKKEEIEVVDLHIHRLLDTTAGLNNADMLAVQMNKFREVMNQHLRTAGKKIVFIHGKGEGVLRHAILDELKRKYPHCEAQDASFREYGFGATQVTIHLNR